MAGDKDDLMEPQWVWELHGWAKASVRQGESRLGGLQTCAALALSAFKRNGVSVPAGQGTSMTRSGGKTDQGKNVPGKKQTLKNPTPN